MNDLFFYGTLRHLPLLEIVLGSPVAALDLQADALPDHAVRAVAEGPFPTIVAQPGAQAEGLLLRDLTPDQIARLDFYEGGFDYDLQEVQLASGARARVYFPQPDRWTAGAPWSLSDWESDWAAQSCLAAREVMRLRGHKTREEIAQMFLMIRARAASKVHAQASRGNDLVLKGRAEVSDVRHLHADFFALEEWRLRHERFDGSLSPEVSREVFVGTDAALVLPYDPVRDRVLLVEQIRMGPLARHDPNAWQLEPIAGRIDPGEDPQTTARREAREEADLELAALEPVAEVYASPGNATEFFYIFVGQADLPDDAAGVSGLESEHEDIRSHVLPLDELLTLCDNQQAANAPLVVAALWLARHRERLRLAWGAATSEER